MKGIVQTYYTLRGYGFILINFRQRIYFHASHWIGQNAPEIGQEIYFDIAPGQPGRGPQAVNVVPTAERPEVQS